MERTYFEIKITFIHILVFLVAVILIGIALFYMGYKAGYRANTTDNEGSMAKKETFSKSKSIRMVSEKPVISQQNKTPQKTIESEERLYPQNKQPGSEIKTEKAKAEDSFFTIQVGAFSSQANARSYAEKFQKNGYLVKVETPEPSSKNGRFFVLVGKYKDYEQAKTEKEKLEKLEKKKFFIVPNR